MPLSNSLTPGATFPSALIRQTHHSLTPQKLTRYGVCSRNTDDCSGGQSLCKRRLPAGGLLADRTLIKIFGAGFNANTKVSIEGTTIVPADQTVVNQARLT